MRAAWLTDLHLDFVHREDIEQLAAEVLDAQPDVVLIGGDIGSAANVAAHLQRLKELLRLPIFFVLGNHDYYHGGVASVRADIASLVARTRDLTWLSVAGPISLTARTTLVGHDGWGDGGFGAAETSPLELNDFVLIEELRAAHGRTELLSVLRALGAEAATHFLAVLPEALQMHERVLALMHVPPFREATWHGGDESTADWLPFFCCRAAGEAMRDVMAGHEDRSLTVLCGHTHSSGYCRPAPNIEVVTGAAEYGQPRLQRVIKVE
jgi:3',5'-cyclic AMP phosphodiesterase CpdA